MKKKKVTIDPKSTRSIRQLEGVEKWVAAGCKATLSYCTGFGKSRVGILIIKRFLLKNPDKKITIIVPSEPLKKQWAGLLEHENIVADVLIINSAVKNLFQTDLLILDECHKYASNLFYQIFEKCAYSMILGLTATFKRLDGKEKLINHFCPVVDEITVEQATKAGWLSPSKIYKVLLTVPDIETYNAYNRAFLDHFSYFNYDFNLAMNCVKDYKARMAYADEMIDETRDFKASLAECTARAMGWNNSLRNRKNFVMKHPKKLEIAKLILQHRPDSKAITFNSTIAQCLLFDSGSVIHSKQKKKENEKLLEEFEAVTTGVIHSSKSLIEGVDISGLNLAVILHNTSSSTERIQKYGRVIRAEVGKTAEIFSLVIKGTMEESWFKSSAQNTTFIDLNEPELMSVLNNIPMKKEKKMQKEEQYLFTF